MLRFTSPIGQPIHLITDRVAESITPIARISFREFRIKFKNREYAISKYCDAKLEIDGYVVTVATSLKHNSPHADEIAIGIDAPRAVKVVRPRENG